MPFLLETEIFMKKLFAKIISLAVVVVMALFILSGCQLITINAERDMNQVIATVKVDDALKQDIYKRELVSSYNSMGYYYVQYQGMTEKEAYELLLENLVKNEIIVQKARIELTKEGGYFDKAVSALQAEGGGTIIEKYLATANHQGTAIGNVSKTDGLDLFLTPFEYYENRYSVLSTVEQYIKGYSDEEEDEHEHDPYETFQGTARSTLTLPTEEEYNEWEMKNDPEASKIDTESDFFKSYKKVNEDAKLELDLSSYTTKYDLAFNVYKKYCDNFSVKNEDRAAVNRLIKDLKKLGFITSEEAAKKTPTTANEFLALTYFKQDLESRYENQIITKYELALQNESEKELAGDPDLYNAYENIFETQKVNYNNDYTAYETALGKASDTSLVVYNPTEGYGYVMNLLIGFSDEQSAIYNSLSSNTTLTAEQKKNARDNLLKTLTAKDLRDTWVESNYGTYGQDGTFTFDKKYVKTEALQKYQGNIYGAKSYTYHDNYDDEKTGYSYEAVKGTEIAFTDFYKDIVCEVMGFDPSSYSGKIENYTSADLDKFKDLVFAYSTDPGSLQDNFGYVYSPKTSKTTYVKEFADAAERAVKGGVGSYEVVATEFGYHIILCTKVIEKSENPIEYKDFAAQANDKLNKESIPYLFKEYQKEALVLDKVSKTTETFFKNALESAVTYYTDKYEDLLAE